MQTIQLNVHKAQTTTPQRESCVEPQKSPIQLDIITDEDLKNKINELFKDSRVVSLAKEFADTRSMEEWAKKELLEDICQINKGDDTLKNKLYFLMYLIDDPNKLCQSGDSHDAEGIKDNIKIKEIQFLQNLIEDPNKLERPIELLKNIANILIYSDSNELVVIRSLNHVLATWHARRDLIETNMKKEEENKRAKAALAKIEEVENKRSKEAVEAVRRARQSCRDKERGLKVLQKGFKELEEQNQELQAQISVKNQENKRLQVEFDYYMAKQIERKDHEEKKESDKDEIERKKLEELRTKYNYKCIELEKVEKTLQTLKPKAGQVPFLQREIIDLQNQIMELKKERATLGKEYVTIKKTTINKLSQEIESLLDDNKILKEKIGDLERKQEEPKETTFGELLRTGKKLLIDSIIEWANRDTLTWDERLARYFQFKRYCNWPQQTQKPTPIDLQDLVKWFEKFKQRPISVQEAYDVQAHHRNLCVKELTPQLLNETRPKDGVIACKFLRAQFALMNQAPKQALQKRQTDLRKKFIDSGVPEGHSAYSYIKNLDQCEPFELSSEAKALSRPTNRHINGNRRLAEMYVAGTLEDKTA